MYKVYSYSPITKSETAILKPWIDSKKSNLYNSYKTLHSGLDIQAHDVYGFQSGVVTHIGKDEDNYYTVTVQYSSNVSLRYGHMLNVYVKSGEILFVGSYIGISYKYVHFEYVTISKGNSQWPVRIGSITYYKQNPEPLISGDTVLNANDWSQIYNAKYYTDESYPLSGAMQDEFFNNRDGED